MKWNERSAKKYVNYTFFLSRSVVHEIRYDIRRLLHNGSPTIPLECENDKKCTLKYPTILELALGVCLCVSMLNMWNVCIRYIGYVRTLSMLLLRRLLLSFSLFFFSQLISIILKIFSFEIKCVNTDC